jgi:glucose-6-phosphate 1-dehydrogenase
MNKGKAGRAQSDALVLFGVTGDLAFKQIFPALYAMARRGVLDLAMVGVASSKWNLAQLRKRAETGSANYFRFRLSPNSAVALAGRVKRAGKEFVGDQRELYLTDERPGEEAPHERLLSDAMAANGALFTREGAVEAARAVVNPVLTKHHRAARYKRGGWGPREADALIAADGGWRNPGSADAASD